MKSSCETVTMQLLLLVSLLCSLFGEFCFFFSVRNS